MSNYPNMSYCMCENTLAAMNQIVNAMQSEGAQFLHDMSRDELRAFRELFMICGDFLSLSQEIEDQADLNYDDNQPDEAQEWADYDPHC